ncbi:MAG: hypothetical protein ABIM89_17845 [Mycobacteriales bacterium]
MLIALLDSDDVDHRRVTFDRSVSLAARSENAGPSSRQEEQLERCSATSS